MIGNSEKFIQHKGLRHGEGLPNSFEAILKNFNGRMECDAVLLKDGNIAIMHERDFGINLEELENMDIKDIESLKIPSNDPNSTARAIPLLREFIGLASDTDTRLALEIKASTLEKTLVLAQKILEQMYLMEDEGGFKYNEKFLETKIVIQSFSVQILKKIQELSHNKNKEIKTGLYWPSDEKWAGKVPLFDWDEQKKINNSLTWHEQGIEVAANNNFSEIEFQPFVITPDLVKKCHIKGLRIGATVVNNEETAKKLLDMEVDYILTEKII
jgi:glycerophosphoryl diester phosphodiesterase